MSKNKIFGEILETFDGFSALEKELFNNISSIDPSQKKELEDFMNKAIEEKFNLPPSEDVSKTSQTVINPLIEENKKITSDIQKDLQEDKSHFFSSLDNVVQEIKKVSQYDKDLEAIYNALNAADRDKEKKAVASDSAQILESVKQVTQVIDDNLQDTSQGVDQTKFNRVKDYFTTKISNILGEARDGINSARERLSKVEIDKEQVTKKIGRLVEDAYDITTSSTLTRSLGLVASLITLQPVGIALEVVGSVAGFGNDYLLTSDTRKQEKTYNNLVKHNNAKAEQESLKLQNPNLFEALEGLYEPSKEGKKSATKEYPAKHPAKMIARAAIPAVIDRGTSAISHATSLITTGNPLSAILLINDARGGLSDTKGSYDKMKFNLRTKQMAHSQAKSSLAPGFDDLQELKARTQEQRIQTMALKETIKSLKTMGINDNDLKNDNSEIFKNNKKIANKIFQTNKKQIESQEKMITSSKTMWDKTKIGIVNTANNLKHTLNPTSDYLHPKRLEQKREKPSAEFNKYQRARLQVEKYVNNIQGVIEVEGKDLPQQKDLQDFFTKNITEEIINNDKLVYKKQEDLIKKSPELNKLIEDLITNEQNDAIKGKLQYIKDYNNFHTERLKQSKLITPELKQKAGKFGAEIEQANHERRDASNKEPKAKVKKQNSQRSM